MAHDKEIQASPKAIKESTAMWENFIFFSKITGGAIAVLLILMALFLV